MYQDASCDEQMSDCQPFDFFSRLGAAKLKYRGFPIASNCRPAGTTGRLLIYSEPNCFFSIVLQYLLFYSSEFVDEVQLGTVEDKAEIIGLHSMSQLQNRHRIDEIDEQVVVTKIG